MSQFPKHPREAERLTVVESLKLFGTPHEERFDSIARRACDATGASICFIDLIGSDTVWFKSAIGIEATHGPREASFCQFTILQDGICYIPDSLQEPMVEKVVGRENFRFYAGFPLKIRDMPVGTLCVCDSGAMTLSDIQRDRLEYLAGMAEMELSIIAMTLVQQELVSFSLSQSLVDKVDVLTRCWTTTAICEIMAREKQNGTVTTAYIDIDAAAPDGVVRAFADLIRASFPAGTAIGTLGRGKFLVVTHGMNETLLHVASIIEASKSHYPVTTRVVE